MLSVCNGLEPVVDCRCLEPDEAIRLDQMGEDGAPAIRYLRDTWCSEGTATRLGVVTDTDYSPAGRIEVSAPHRELLDQVLDRWSLQVLSELCEGPARFNVLRKRIPAVTQKSLTGTLRRLERNGIIERNVISTRPLAVEYRITPLGKTIKRPIDAILAWANTYMPSIEAARISYDDAVQ
jgi:DNA-binding HxlR family transcriptional regulator